MTVTLTEAGLSTSTQQQITTDTGARFKTQFGDNIDLNPTESISGQEINILSETKALDEQATLATYRSMDPANAIGRALDSRLALTGTTRKGETRSEVDGLLAFSGADTYVAGSLIRNNDTQDLWRLVANVVAGAPGSFAATFQAVDPGPLLAAAGSTWTIVTTNVNVTGFTNPTDDADPGRLVETDAAAKARRITELYSQNIGGLAAIDSVVSRLVNDQTGIGSVIGIRTYHNPTEQPFDPVTLIPFKAFNVVLELSPSVPDAATQQAIHDAIMVAMGAGGEAYGTSYVGASVDTEGTSQPIAFDVVVDTSIVLEIDLLTSTSEDAVSQNITTVVAAQILSDANALHEVAGRDVLALDYQGIIQRMQAAGEISGVVSVVVRMSISPAAAAAVDRVVMGIRQKPDFDSANITVIEV